MYSQWLPAWSRALLAAVGAAFIGSLLVATPAEASDTPGPSVAWSKEGWSGPVGAALPMTGTYAGQSDPSSITVEHLDKGAWVASDVSVAASNGSFTVDIVPTAAAQSLRVVLKDANAAPVATSGVATVSGTPAKSTITISLPKTVVDYHSVTLKATWRTEDGRKPNGVGKLQFRAKGTKTYVSVGSFTITGGAGSKVLVPRDDGRYRVSFASTKDLSAIKSASSPIDNRPPGTVVHLPKKAPKPKISLPAQPRWTRAKVDYEIHKLSDKVWASMKNRTWHKGCPVGRKSLRIIEVSYWAFDGYVRRGEIVVNKSVAPQTAKIFRDLFAHRTPIRSMYREDRFGWSKSLHGADDNKSMKADNTSGFNCRRQVGWTKYRSPHSYGKSIDLNTWENPFASHSGYNPNKSWAKRTKPANITWRGKHDSVVKIFKKHGFRWLGKHDLQHFQH